MSRVVSFNADTSFKQKSQRRPNVRKIARRGRNNNTQPPISQQHTPTTTTNNNAAISRKRTHSTMMIGNDIIRSTKMNNAKRMSLGLKLLSSGSITGSTNVSAKGGEEQQSNIGNGQVNGELEDVLLKSIPEDKETNKGIEEGDDNTIEIDATAVQKEDQESSSKPASSVAATTTNRTASRSSIGNVMELLDNFDDIEEVLDLTEMDNDDAAAATAVGNKSMESKTANKKNASTTMPKDDEGDDETTSSPARENNDTVSFVGIGDMLVDDDDDSEDGDDDDNQLFTQPPECGEARGFSQSPKALKRGPKARPKKNQIDEQQIVDSQVPLPLTRKAASEKSLRHQHSLDEEDEEEEDVDFGPQQIPLPFRRASQKSVPSEPKDEDEDDGILYQELQMPIPTKKKKSPLPTKKSKRWRKNMQEEETVPRSLRKQPPELLGQMNVSGDDRRQSQIPLPTRKRVSNERQVVAEEEEGRRQSQISLPTRKKKKRKTHHSRFSLQSNHYKSSEQHNKYSESEEEEDDDADVVMIQVPINLKKQSTRRKSHLKFKPKVVYSSDTSSDSDKWMRIIRRTAKPENTVVKSKKSRSSLLGDSSEKSPAEETNMDSDDDSEDDQSQSPGEGSQEIPRKRLRADSTNSSARCRSSGSNKQPSTSQQQTITTTNMKKYSFPPWMIDNGDATISRKQSSSDMSASAAEEEVINFESSHDIIDSPPQQFSHDNTQKYSGSKKKKKHPESPH